MLRNVSLIIIANKNKKAKKQDKTNKQNTHTNKQKQQQTSKSKQKQQSKTNIRRIAKHPHVLFIFSLQGPPPHMHKSRHWSMTLLFFGLPGLPAAHTERLSRSGHSQTLLHPATLTSKLHQKNKQNKTNEKQNKQTTLQSHPVAVHSHWANQFQHQPNHASRLTV